MRVDESSFLRALSLVLLVYVAGAGLSYAVLRDVPSGAEIATYVPSGLAILVGLICVHKASFDLPSAGRGYALAGGLGSGASAGLAAASFALSDGHTLDYGAVSDGIHAVFVAPLSEELLFTGFLFSVLRKRRGFLLSTATVAIVFTLVHLPSMPSSFLARLTHSIAVCVLYEEFSSLPVVVLQHFMSNAVPYLLAVLVDGEKVFESVPESLLTVAGFFFLLFSVLIACARSFRHGGPKQAPGAVTAFPTSDTPAPG